MKITVTQRIEINGHVEEYSASADVDPPIGILDEPSEAEIASETAKELFKSLP